MTQKRRPGRTARTTRAAKKSSRPRPRQQAAAGDPARNPPGDALDDFIGAAAQALDLKIEPAWLPTVRENLRVILLHGAKVSEARLPDDAEPAPVFRA